MILTQSALRDFKVDDFSLHALKVYKDYLIARNVAFKEFSYDSAEDVGLRGIAGVRYKEKVCV